MEPKASYGYLHEMKESNLGYHQWYKYPDFHPINSGFYWVAYYDQNNIALQGIASFIPGSGFSKENVTSWRELS